MRKFYMVVNLTTKGSPVVEHLSAINADAEAARLAEKNPGQTFVVLEARTAFKAKTTLHTEPCSNFETTSNVPVPNPWVAWVQSDKSPCN